MELSKEKIYSEIMKLPENGSLVKYASKFVVLSKEGTRYVGRCPFCYQQNRLTIFKDSNSFHCFWCSKDGDILYFRNLLLDLFERGSLDLKYNLTESAIRKRSREIIIENLMNKNTKKVKTRIVTSWNDNDYQGEEPKQNFVAKENSKEEYSQEEIEFKEKLKVGVNLKYYSNEVGVIVEKTEKTITIKYPSKEITLDIYLAIKSKGIKIV